MKRNTNSLAAIAFRKFYKNKVGMCAFGHIVICGFIAIFCYLVAPDNSSNANQMHLEIHSKAPGFSTTLLEIPNPKKSTFFERFLFGEKHPPTELLIQDCKIDSTYAEVTLLDQITIKKIPLNTFHGNIQDFLKEKTYYFGTDRYGRDLLSRILIGTRISFFIGFIAVFISLVLGIFMGSLAGYFGGKIDAIVSWVINITWSIPTLLLVIAITLTLGKGVWQVFIAVGLTMWVEVARVVRGQILSVKKTEYIEAAKVLGFSNMRIIFQHILPNIMAPIIVISAANFAASILIESGLSFLGIGAQPPIPSWGGIIKDHFSYVILGKPYLAIIPGIAILTIVMAFMLTGNALRDSLDVKNNS